MRVKDEFFNRGFFKIGDGKRTRFWEDSWLGDTPLQTQYPSLYSIVQNKDVLVHDVLAGAPPLNMIFRRALIGDRWDAWSHLCLRLMDIDLTLNSDTFVWKLTNNGMFTVKSLYEDLMNDHTVFLRKYLWKLKIRLKIKIFMWFLNRKVLLTKDNLVKRNWNGCTKCSFCGCDESIDHLFISCPFARLIWRELCFVLTTSLHQRMFPICLGIG